MAAGKAFRAKTLRLMMVEASIIDRACSALNGMERTQLVQEAVLAEANRLGIRFSVSRPRPLNVSWPYIPERGDEPTAERLTITVSLPVAEILMRCAEHVHTSEPLFVIGSTLAYIGRLQKCFGALSVETAEEASQVRDRLRRIKLPRQYEYQFAAKE